MGMMKRLERGEDGYDRAVSVHDLIMERSVEMRRRLEVSDARVAGTSDAVGRDVPSVLAPIMAGARSRA